MYEDTRIPDMFSTTAPFCLVEENKLVEDREGTELVSKYFKDIFKIDDNQEYFNVIISKA